VISAGRESQYQHPRRRTIEALASILPRLSLAGGSLVRAFDGQKNTWVDLARTAAIRITSRDGHVVIRSDGARVNCR
jgi:hypothetical protein